jgi:hypothetical protein
VPDEVCAPRCVQIDEAIAAYRELSTLIADAPTVREIEKLIQKYRLLIEECFTH